MDRTWPILAAKSAKNDPNLASQNDPKSTKNRRQKSIEILIQNKTNFMRHLGRSGGMCWPPGGIIGGSKNYTAGLWFCILKICRFLWHIMALRFGDLAFGLGIGFRSGMLCSAPRQGGRRIASHIPPGQVVECRGC